jgi:hypothetical protein
MTTILYDIINDKLSKNEIINIYKLSSQKFKTKIKKIIIIKNINNIYQQKLDSEKNSFIASLLNKMQNKITDKKTYNSNKQLIYKILKIPKDNYKNIYREIFKQKPIEEQIIIRNNINNKIKLRFLNMSHLEKKQYREHKKNKRIKKIGLDAYKLIIRNRFNKWYNSLSDERKEIIKNKRNLRYQNLSLDKKYKLLERHKLYYHNLSNDKKREYQKNKKRLLIT